MLHVCAKVLGIPEENIKSVSTDFGPDGALSDPTRNDLARWAFLQIYFYATFFVFMVPFGWPSVKPLFCEVQAIECSASYWFVLVLLLRTAVYMGAMLL